MADKLITAGQNPVRAQEIATGEYAQEVYTVNAVTAAVAKQKFYASGSAPLTLSVSGNIRATISNPAVSGVSLFIPRITIFSNAAGEARLFVNPTAGLPASAAQSHLNAIIGAPGGAAVIKADTSATTALSGGTDTGITLAFDAGRRVVIDLPPMVLTPGVTLGINVPIAAASSRSFLNVLFFEE